MSACVTHLDPAPSCREHRKGETLKLGTCISTVFAQIFHRNRALGSPRSYLSDCSLSAENNKENDIWLQTVDVALKDVREGFHAGSCVTTGDLKACCGASGSIREGGDSPGQFTLELRHLLGAEQEPFVLQDAIREKRQPVRIKSSYGLTDPWLQGEKRRTRKRSNSDKVDNAIKVSESCCSTTTTTKKVEEIHVESALASDSPRRSRGPPERMVALPSSDKSHVHRARSKMDPALPASKRAGKRALLMEAAVKILEGGSSRSRRQPAAASVRFLFSEPDGAKNMYGDKSMKTVIDSQTELRETKKKKKKKKKRKKNGAQTKPEAAAALFRSSSARINGGIGESERLADGERDMTAAAGNGCLLGRVFLPGNEAEAKIVDMAMKSRKEATIVLKHGGALESSEFLRGRRERAVSSSSSELYLASSGESRRNSTSSSSITSSTPMSLSAQASPEHFQIHKLARSPTIFDPSLLDAARPILLDGEVEDHSCFPYSSSSSSESHAVDVPCSSAVSLDRKTSLMCSPVEAEMGRNSICTGKQIIQIQRLCDFSWWERELHSQRAFATSTAEGCTDELEVCRTQNVEQVAGCEECASPTAIRGSLCANPPYKDDGRPSDPQIELSPSATTRPAIHEFKQFSPVSVLDPISDEDEESNDGDPLDSFEEAKQNLLENVRRFEMLAQMDLDTLMKLAEEHPASDIAEECSDSQEENSQRSVENCDDDGTYVWSRDEDNRPNDNRFGSVTHQSVGGDVYTGGRAVNVQILDLLERFREGTRSSCHDDSRRQITARIYRWPAVPADILHELGSPTLSSWLSAIDCKLYSEWGGSLRERKHSDDYCEEIRQWAVEMEATLLGSLVQEMVAEMMVGA